MCRLSEDVAYLGHKLRQRELARAAELDIDAAHTHGQAGGILPEVPPESAMSFLHLGDGKLEVLLAQCQNFDIVGILDLKLDGERLVVGRCGRDLHVLDIHLVVNHQCGIRRELEGSVKLLGLRLRLPGLALALIIVATRAPESLIHILEVRDFVVELLQCQSGVEAERRLVGYLVAAGNAVHNRTAIPVIGSVIAGIGCDEAQNGYSTERCLVAGGERLVVGPRCTQVLDTLPHRVLPYGVLVGQQTLVDLPDGLEDVGGSRTVERRGERLDGTPRNRELSVPKEVLAHCHGQFDIDAGLVARLLLIVVSRHVGVEGDVGGQPSYLVFAEEFHVLVLLADHARKGLERLDVGCPAVLEAATVVVGVLVDVVRVVEVLLIARVAEREVGRIPWHGILAELVVELKSRDAEALHRAQCHGIVVDRVLLVSHTTRLRP